MRETLIRHLAVADEPALVAAAFFESKVQIWSWKSAEQLGEFETILDFGGRRLALTPDGRTCIAGGYGRGLAAYSVPDGKLIWRRRDLHRVQYVTLSASGSEIFCGNENPTVHIIETETGSSVGKIPGADRIIPSQIGPHQLVSRRKGKYTVQGDHKLEIPMISFGLLDAAFSKQAVCLSEPTTGIRCIELASGPTIWHHEALGANHLAFNQSDERFYCVGGLDNEPYEPSLIRLASRLVDCRPVVSLSQSYHGAFAPSGSVLITAEGQVYETATGKLLSFMEFPKHDNSPS